MIKIEDVLKVVLKGIEPLDSESVGLMDSVGRVLAEDVYASSAIPAFDNSAMDGYAIRSLDVLGASREYPKVLNVIEDIRAGYLSKKALKAGQAIRIMTGAPIPKGADSVIMVEDTEKMAKKEFVKIFKETSPGENIRKFGEDIKKGEGVIRRGALLGPAHIGLLASLGTPKVRVTRKPMVAILATGDEIVGVGQKLTPGKLHSSNTYTMYGQILKCGGIPKDLGIVKDEPAKLKAKIREGLDCDLILTSGGVSVGDYDLVKAVLARMGTDIKFWKVAMRPGKPLVFGHIRGIPIFGLPGNPVSSMITFEIFVRPIILKMLGQTADTMLERHAVVEEDMVKKKGLRYFLRAQTRWEKGAYITRTTGAQGSGILKSMALANSLIILPEEEEKIGKGGKVAIRFL